MRQDVKKRIKGIPDIVICLDVTASMGGCLEQLKQQLAGFITELEKPQTGQEGIVVQVSDWRIRLLPFRDLINNPLDGPYPAIIDDLPFCTTAEGFRAQLEDPRCEAKLRSKDEPESVLDAIYRAAKKTAWRPADEAHRFVIVFSDASTHKTLHLSTASGGPDDVSEVVQAIKTSRIKPVLFAPRTPEYEAIYKAVEATRPDLVKGFPLMANRDEAVAFFQMKDTPGRERFARILLGLAQTVSRSSSEEL